VDAGLREQDGRWRLSMDPLAFAVGAPDMPQLLARSQAPVTLARGKHDAMNTDEQLTRLGVPTVTLPSLGHNAAMGWLVVVSHKCHTKSISRGVS
jgi:hypothetical protein